MKVIFKLECEGNSFIEFQKKEVLDFDNGGSKNQVVINFYSDGYFGEKLDKCVTKVDLDDLKEILKLL